MVGSNHLAGKDGCWLPRASQRALPPPPPPPAWSSGPLVTRALFSKNKRYERGNEFTKLSRHRSAMHGSMVVGWREEGGWLERFSNKTKD